MDATTRADVKELAEDLDLATRLDPRAVLIAGAPSNVTEAFMEKVLDAVTASGGRWDGAVTAAVLKLSSAGKMDPGNPTAAPFGTPLTTLLRAIRQAVAVVGDRGAEIPGPERDGVRAFLASSVEHRHLASRVPPEPAPTEADATVPSHVPFRFPYRQGRSKSHSIGEGTVQLGVVPPERAPVVATLTPDGGDAFDVRLVDGRLMRPVFAPGSWRPMDVGSFLRAAQEAPAWVDNPFLPSPPWDASLAPLDDVALPPTSSRPGDEQALEEARVRHEADGRGLACIGGVVHVPCGEPRLHLTVKRKESKWRSVQVGSVRVAWTLGPHLDAFTEMGTDRVGADEPVYDLLAGYDRGRGGREGEVAPNRSTSLGFGLGDADALLRVARSAEGRMSSLTSRRIDFRNVRWKTSLTCATWDPGHFQATSEPLLDVLARHQAVTGDAWATLPDLAEARASHADAMVDAAGSVASFDAIQGKCHYVKVSMGYEVTMHPSGLDDAGQAGAAVLCELAALDLRRVAEHGPRVVGEDDEVASLSL